jgi:hypothetical protein
MKPSHYEKILGVLIELKQAHPKCTMAKHLATALEENFWGMTDKEMLEALQKYQTNISLDVRHSDNDIDEIIKDAMNLTLHEDEEDD